MLLLDPSLSFAADVQRLLHAHALGRGRLTTLMWNKIYYKYGCHVSPFCHIDPSVYFPHPIGIVIGANSVVGAGCVIYQHVTLGRAEVDRPEYPVLMDGCIVYANASVLGQSILGVGTVVGAHSMAIDISAGDRAILVGVPARDISSK